MKMVMCTTYKLDNNKNPPEEAKGATFIKFFNVEKNPACTFIKILRYNLVQLYLTLMSTYVCPSGWYTVSHQKTKKYSNDKS